MSSFIRGAVSKKKRRYQKNGFDLDLTYVTPRIVAMGFPSENVEAAYRNPMKEVLRFLDSFHKDHYKVYNLCSERGYDHEKFYNRVGVYPFDDHNAPPFEMIQQFCKDVEQWLQEDEKNIAVIHCKAGKGRTGLMISAWMVYSKEWPTAKDALSFYAAMRTFNQKGVTIPSQIRYVHYFEESMKGPSEAKTLLLNKIVFHTLPKSVDISDVNFNVHVGKTLVFTYKDYEDQRKKEEGKKEKEKKTKKKNDDDEETASFGCGNVPLVGDIKIEFQEKSSKLFGFWFCSSFVKENRLLLKKEELDKAHKDSNHKTYHQNFRIELLFSDLSSSPDQASISSPAPVSSSGSDASVSLSSTSSTSPASSPSETNGLKDAAEADGEKPTDQFAVALATASTGEWVLNKDLKESSNKGLTEDPNAVSERLLTLLLESCKAGIRGGTLIETHTRLVRASPAFQAFQQLTPRLNNVSLTGLSPEAALSFWLNVHNMLVVHSRVLLAETPKKKEGVLALHQTAKYRIGGRLYSGSDIEVAVVRSATSVTNESPFIGTPFAVDDARRVYTLLQHDPRIVFAFYRGTESCPTVRVYNHETLSQDLDEAAKYFLETNAFVDNFRGEVWLPKILSWHRAEFGYKDLGLKEVVKKYMEVKVPDFNIKYNQFTWEFEMHPWFVIEERERAARLAQERREQVEREQQIEREKRYKRERHHTNSHRTRDIEGSSRRDRDDRDRERDREREERDQDRERDRDRERREKRKSVREKDSHKEKERDRRSRDLDKEKRDSEEKKRERRKKAQTVSFHKDKPVVDKDRYREKDGASMSKSTSERHHRDHKEHREHKDRKERTREKLARGKRDDDISSKDSRRMSL